MKKYDAFISYTHSSEMDLAMALDDGLTRFAKPWNKLRAKRIYRDTDSQALTPNLLGAVQQAMDNSEFLILMASPAAARSNWVPEEVAHWAKSRSLEKLLIVVCDGEVAWDDEAGDFDWEKTDCLPQALGGLYEGQPLYLDMRWARGESDLSLQNDRFKDSVARLSAALSGKSVEDMLSEEVIQFRRTTRIRNAAIATLSVLFVAATVAAVLAVQARNEAVRQRDQAIKNNLLNEVRNDLNNNGLGRAVQVARKAREKFGADPQIRNIAWEIVRSPAAAIRESYDLDWVFARWSPAGDRLMMGFDNAGGSLDILVQDRFGGNVTWLDEVYGAYFLGDGSKLLALQPSAPALMPVGGVDAEIDDSTAFCGNDASFRMDINPGGLSFGLVPFTGVMHPQVYDLRSQDNSEGVPEMWFGEPIHVCGDYLRLFSEEGDFIRAIHTPGVEKAAAAPDLQRIAVQYAENVVIVTGEGKEIARVGGRDPVWSADGTLLATVMYGEVLDYSEATQTEYPFDPPSLEGMGPWGEQVADLDVEEMVVTGDEYGNPYENAGNGFTRVWSVQGELQVSVPGTHPFFTLDGVMTVGGFTVAGEVESHPRLWALEPGSGGAPRMRMELEGFQVTVSPDERWIASADMQGRTWIYGRNGRRHAVVEGGAPVFHPVQPLLMTNNFGHLRQWHLPSLRSSSASVVAEALGVSAAVLDKAVERFPDCIADCEPPDGYAVELEGIWTGSWSVTPGTINEGAEVETIIRISRASETGTTAIQHRVKGCESKPEHRRYRDHLMLLTCFADDTWRIYDLDVNEGIEDPENHHAQSWGVHEGGLDEAVFTADGRSVISIGPESVRIWDVSTAGPGPAPVTLPVGLAIRNYAISDDSRLLALVPEEGPAQVWNFQGERLASFGLRTAGEEFEGVSFFNGSTHLVFGAMSMVDYDRFYIPWTVDLDTMFEMFDWLPDLSPEETERLGLN